VASGRRRAQTDVVPPDEDLSGGGGAAAQDAQGVEAGTTALAGEGVAEREEGWRKAGGAEAAAACGDW